MKGMPTVLPADERSPADGSSSPTAAHEIVELVVLTGDEHFLATLREAVNGATRLWHVSSPEKITDLLLAGEVGILAIDGAAVTGHTAFIQQLKRQFPELVVLFAGTREDETHLTGQISDGTVYRFIHKPLSSARARLFVQAAIRKHEDPRSTMVLPAMIRPARKSRVPMIAAGAGVALIVALGIWLFPFVPRRPAPPAVAPAAASNAEAQLRRANLAAIQGRLVARAEDALLQDRLDDASAAIEDARRAGVESSRIAFLTAQLGKARSQQGAAARARPPAPVEPPKSSGDALPQVLRLAAERLDQGRLLEPESDSALFHFRRAMEINPDDLGVQQTRRALAARLLLEASTSMQSRDFDRADRLLQAATGIASQHDIDAAHTNLASLRNAARDDKPRPSGPVSAAAPTPAQATATAPAKVAPPVPVAPTPGPGQGADVPVAQDKAANPETVGATSLTRLSGKTPVYPLDAQRQGIEGWVDIEFLVRTDGSVHEPIIRNAQPAGVFDQAAIRAVQTWRFRPVMREGKPVEQRARLRLRFSLNQ